MNVDSPTFYLEQLVRESHPTLKAKKHDVVLPKESLCIMSAVIGRKPQEVTALVPIGAGSRGTIGPQAPSVYLIVGHRGDSIN